MARLLQRRNRLVKGNLKQGIPCPGILPPTPLPEYVNYRSRVRKWCIIQLHSQVAGRTYTIPSRLIGKEVQVRMYADWVEVYYKVYLVERMERVR